MAETSRREGHMCPTSSAPFHYGSWGDGLCQSISEVPVQVLGLCELHALEEGLAVGRDTGESEPLVDTAASPFHPPPEQRAQPLPFLTYADTLLFSIDAAGVGVSSTWGKS